MENPQKSKFLKLRGARVNNLKNIDVDIPLKQFTIVTGVSGSGKSSLVFDTLYAEGQRRYVESLSTYTRQFLEKMPKPDIDGIENISPAIALEQKNTINNNRSTVATMSELYDYFRLLFAKIGKTFCVNCKTEVRSESAQTISQHFSKNIKKYSDKRFYLLSRIDTAITDKKTWPITQKSLIQKGFNKISFLEKNGDCEILELTEATKLPAKFEKCFLVIDRMTMPENPEIDSRFSEALEQGFAMAAELGTNTIDIGFVEKENPKKWVFETFSDKFRCDTCGTNYLKPEPQMFSFNSPLGACSHCSGFGFNLELDEDLIIPDKRKTIRNGAVDPLSKPASEDAQFAMFKLLEKNKVNLGKRYEDLSKSEKKLIWEGDGSTRGFQGLRAYFDELKTHRYKLHVRVFIRRYQTQILCPECVGSRLKKESLSVLIGKNELQKNIGNLLALSIERTKEYFDNLLSSKSLGRSDLTIANDILKQVQARLTFMVDVGVGYLTLNRLGKTLSGGECQRIALATQLGNKLCSTLYVLDEPSIGLHPADTEKLIGLIKKLRDHGNTIVVVEHDLDVIAAADHMIELGPYAGYRGGEVIAAGSYADVLKNKGCLTSKYLDGTFTIEERKKRRPVIDQPDLKELKIEGACENNLKDITVSFPLNRLISVTGLSGSGKTTLIHKTLFNSLDRLFHKENVQVGKFLRLYGADHLNDVVMLDQRPIGKSSRSNPATYLKIWDDIRKIYANQSLSIRRGFAPQHFSFNVDGGRCPICKGEGEITLDMHFMSEMKLPCEECDGKKFKKNVLEVEFKKKNIYQLMCTTVDECIDLFREYPAVCSKLQVLKKVGLGYLQLGQSSTTLSGGESQRLKIASVLLERASSNMLYIFDEPTTGLHIDDVKKLLDVLQDLVDQKNTVILIEHNLELVQHSDWVIDLGPGGGEHGGNLIATGTPEDIIKNSKSITGKFLKLKRNHRTLTG